MQISLQNFSNVQSSKKPSIGGKYKKKVVKPKVKEEKPKVKKAITQKVKEEKPKVKRLRFNIF